MLLITFLSFLSIQKTLAALCAACFYTTLAVIYIKSDQHPVVRLNSTIVDYKLNSSNYYLIWLNIAIFIWVCHFIYACQHYITSASIAKWYFKRFLNQKWKNDIKNNN